MGCGSHRMFPWLLPIYIQDCLLRNGSTDTLCHTQFLGLLTLKAMKGLVIDIHHISRYIAIWVVGAVLLGRLFL